MPETETRSAESAVLTILREHSIGAFNGSQSACSRCRKWMTHEEYREHLAALIAQHPAAPETETDANGLLARVDWMDLWWQMTGDDWPVPDDFPGRFAKIVARRLGASALLADRNHHRARAESAEAAHEAEKAAHERLRARVEALAEEFARRQSRNAAHNGGVSCSIWGIAGAEVKRLGGGEAR